MRSQNSAHPVKWWRDVPLIGLGLLFTIALGSMIVVSSIRQLSNLEAILFQVLTLAAGLLGSYRFGQNMAREDAISIIRPHARSAMRRVLELRDSLYNLSNRIEEFKNDKPDPRLDFIQGIIDERIPTGRSAIEDWNDIVPDDVNEILRRWEGKENGSGN